MAKRDSFGLAKQTVLGTKVTVMEQFPPVSGVDIKDAGEKIATDETLGIRAPTVGEKGTKGWELTAKGNVRPNSFPKIASGVGGTPTKTQPDVALAPNAWSYLFSLKDPDPFYFSLLATLKDPLPTALVALFWDAMATSLKISAQPNGYLEFEAGYFALDLDRTQAVPTPTFDATKRFPFDTAKVFVSVNGGGETEIKVRGWEFDYDAGVDEDAAVLGSRKLDSLGIGDNAASISFSPVAGLPAWWDRAVADDPDSVKVRMAATGPIIGGAVAYKVEVIAYLVQVDEAPAGIDAASRLSSIPVKGTCYYDDATSKFCTVEIVSNANNLA